MGVVHLARRPDGERVALKMLRPHIVGDEEARARLAREVGSLSRVRSSWVAEIVDADPWAEVPYVATRYVPGLSLHDHVLEEGPIEGDDLLWFAACLAEGLASVHEVGVLHRDIKPSNVLMEGRTPILIDFGLARVADDPKLTHTGWLLGTPGYLAPEILYGEDATPAADVHSWAATVAYAATGAPPFGRGPSMAIMDRVRRGEHDLSGMSGPLRDVVAGASTPSPSSGPPSTRSSPGSGRRPPGPARCCRRRSTPTTTRSRCRSTIAGPPAPTPPPGPRPRRRTPCAAGRRPPAAAPAAPTSATTTRPSPLRRTPLPPPASTTRGSSRGTRPRPTRRPSRRSPSGCGAQRWSSPAPGRRRRRARPLPWARRGVIVASGCCAAGRWPPAPRATGAGCAAASGTTASRSSSTRRGTSCSRSPRTLMLVLWAAGLAASAGLICYAVGRQRRRHAVRQRGGARRLAVADPAAAGCARRSTAWSSRSSRRCRHLVLVLLVALVAGRAARRRWRRPPASTGCPPPTVPSERVSDLGQRRSSALGSMAAPSALSRRHGNPSTPSPS